MMTKPSARAAPLAKVTKERGRLAAAQADIAETKAAKLRGSLVDAAEVEAEWGGVLRTVRASMLAVPSRVSQRLPHLTVHDVAEIDAEVREALTEIGSSA
jgi:phage terminase Nu1 subunit (DNA packaging protein)